MLAYIEIFIKKEFSENPEMTGSLNRCRGKYILHFLIRILKKELFEIIAIKQIVYRQYKSLSFN